MAGRHSLELKPVPEYDKLSTSAAGPLPPLGSRGRAGGASGGRDGSAPPLGQPSVSLSRYTRNPLGRQQGSLGRTSIVVKLQQSGRQLIDLGRLQAKWLSDTLAKKSEAQDYVNEEDQGFVALLARHVDVPNSEWMRFASPGGQFWQAGYASTAGDLARHTRLGSDEQREGQAEEGLAHERLEGKPRRSVFGLPVIHPYNMFAIAWTMAILLLDLTYTAFWVPVNVAFCTAEYGKISSGCTSSELAGGILYFLNALLGFQIGVVATHGYRKRTVVDGRRVAWLYARYGRFWLDFVASVPFVYLVVVLAGRSHFQLNKGWVHCLSLLRLLRMVRLLSITKVVYMDSLSGRFQDSWLARWMSVTVIYSIFLAYQLAVALNLFASIMVLCAYFEGYDNSWMTSVSWANLPNAGQIYQWYCAVYWMIVTATTTGFGDFQPRSLAEQVVANVVMLFGMIMFGVLVASIGNALSKATAEAHQAYAARRKIMHVMDWAETRALPPDIRKQVQNFYADKYGRKEEDSIDAAVMAELPSRLRAKVARAMCVPLMADVHILMELPEDVQLLLAENMRPLRLPAGEDLCQQGDIAGCFWILHEGTVEAVRYKEGKVTVDASETPRLLGESVLLGDVMEACRVRPWTLRTVTPCRLWGITIGELYPLLRMYPALGVLAAEYVKYKVAYTCKNEQEGRESPDPDDHFCELAAVILKHLKDHMTEDEAAEVVQDLFRTSAEEGSLQPYLEQLLEVCNARRGAAVSGHPHPGAGGTTMERDRTTAGGRGANAVGAAGPGHGAGPDGQHAHPHGSTTPPGPPPQQLHQQLLPQQHSGHGHQPPPAHSNSAFGNPAVAAALAAELQGAGPGAPPAALSAVGSVPDSPISPFSGAGAGATAGPGSAGVAAAVSALSAGASGGGGGGGGTVHCPGCQRCVCPSCGQGMEAGGPGPTSLGGGVPASPALATLVAQGVSHRPTAGPGVRNWVNRMGTLSRMTTARPDHVWAMGRKSVDLRQLGVMSIAPIYD